VFAGLIPTNDGDVLAFAGGSSALVASAGTRPADRFGNLLQDGLADLGDRVGAAAARPGTRFHEFAGAPPQLRRARGPGWALVGDAGSSEDPLTAHGMTTALRDAELLSRGVVAAHQGEQSMACALGRYQTERDRLSMPVFRAAENLASFAGDEDFVHSELLRLNSAMTEESETLARLDTAWPAMPAPRRRAAVEPAPTSGAA
jgi:2-polyprenyl-6-methoxyphenol hydroxylase-like FAD-dependent oxidoreductase